jgi:hypothetical protein
MLNVEELKKIYSPGTRVRLIYMDDDFGVPSGIKGRVNCVDDVGQIHVNWDNGSTLALIYGVDKFEKIKEKEMER